MSASRKRRIAAFAAAIERFATVLVTGNALCKKRKKEPNRSRRSATYKRAAIIRPLNSSLTTRWKMILSCGTDDDFLTSVNDTKDLFLLILLPQFQHERLRCNYGSPYRTGPKTRGRSPQPGSVDLLGLSLWYLKAKGTLKTLCPIFGVTPTSLSVGLEQPRGLAARG